MYGLPQAGILAEKQLIRFLRSYGYTPVHHTPGLWHAPSVFVSSLMTSVSNTSAKNTTTISSNSSATITKKLTLTGMANDSAVSTWTGIMTNTHALSACPAMSRLLYTNFSTQNPTGPKIALIPPPQNNTASKSNSPTPSILQPICPRTKLNASNKSSERSYFTVVPSTPPYSLPSANSPPLRQRLLKPPNARATNFSTTAPPTPPVQSATTPVTWSSNFTAIPRTSMQLVPAAAKAVISSLATNPIPTSSTAPSFISPPL